MGDGRRRLNQNRFADKSSSTPGISLSQFKFKFSGTRSMECDHVIIMISGVGELMEKGYKNYLGLNINYDTKQAGNANILF